MFVCFSFERTLCPIVTQAQGLSHSQQKHTIYPFIQ